MAVYISFDYDVCKRVHELEPNAGVQYLNGDIAPAQLRQDGINGADYHYSAFTKNPGWIKEAKDNNIAHNAWTITKKQDMEWLLKEGFVLRRSTSTGAALALKQAYAAQAARHPELVEAA